MARAWCTFERKIVHRSTNLGYQQEEIFTLDRGGNRWCPFFAGLLYSAFSSGAKSSETTHPLSLRRSMRSGVSSKNSARRCRTNDLSTLASRPNLNPSFAVCNQSTLMTRTIVHSLCMFDFFIFFRKKSKRMRADNAKNRYKKLWPNIGSMSEFK